MLTLAINAMQCDADLWNNYCADFVVYKLKPNNTSTDIGQQILCNFFKHLDKSFPNTQMLERIVHLHCSVSMKKFNIDQVIALLHPLSKVLCFFL